jgi:hypothetical protein
MPSRSSKSPASNRRRIACRILAFQASSSTCQTRQQQNRGPGTKPPALGGEQIQVEGGLHYDTGYSDGGVWTLSCTAAITSYHTHSTEPIQRKFRGIEEMY